MNIFQQNKTNRGPCLRHPLMIILDRDVDLISSIQHSSHYQVGSHLSYSIAPCE